jgi:hypothetical protein
VGTLTQRVGEEPGRAGVVRFRWDYPPTRVWAVVDEGVPLAVLLLVAVVSAHR